MRNYVVLVERRNLRYLDIYIIFFTCNNSENYTTLLLSLSPFPLYISCFNLSFCHFVLFLSFTLFHSFKQYSLRLFVFFQWFISFLVSSLLLFTQIILRVSIVTKCVIRATDSCIYNIYICVCVCAYEWAKFSRVPFLFFFIGCLNIVATPLIW